MTQERIAAIVADPKAYGIVFTLETVKSDGQEYTGVPVCTVEDLPKFEAAFPGVALAALNGQSVRVNSQRIGRTSREKGKADVAEITQANISWLLGIRAPSGFAPKFVGPNDEQYATKEEAKTAWLAFATAQ